jgi:adenylate cyclase class 2
MYEIELKAHIYNRKETIKILNTFANYVGFFQKHDSYYKLQKQNSNDFISVRIRKELSKQEQNISEKIYLTYKQKELKNTSDGTKIEVNNEKECELSNSETVISILLDTGFYEYLSKSKTVEKFTYQTPYGIATIEICTIPPIGDFIEIEILNDSNNESNVDNIRKEILSILEKCNIPQSQIEEKFYSQLLKEANSTII